jgi:CDP-glycerol glycerophosphotransferase
VHFTGYDYKRIQQFARAKANRVIFVHNNMGEEIRVRNTQHSRTLKYAYNNYDHIAIVSEDMMEPTKEFCLDENRIAVVNNTIDYKKYQKMGLETAAFDENTESTHTLEEVQAILDSNAKKFISVGRFSPEKGHEQLIEAFDEIAKEHEDVYLIIIGGHGVLYEQTLELRESLACKDRIVIIKSMSNPQPIIHQSDYFVLSSHHEGLGLVILEADIQNVPVVSTDILGPRGFMKKHGGTLVEDSKEGLVKGLKMCLNGQVKAMNADYEEYNQQAIEEFTSVLTPVKKA